VNLLHHWLAAAAVLSLCACTTAPLPTRPSPVSSTDAAFALTGYEPAFYRALLQNGHDSPDRLESVRLLRAPIRIYLRTTDEAGRAIDENTLAMTERVLRDSALIWSGGTFGISEVLRGTASRERVAGWITVKWSAAPMIGRCGRSTVGTDGGFIELDGSGACSCGSATRVYPRLIRHELGHAMGYYHTDGVDDVMYGRTISADACDLSPSSRERRHAQLAHTPSFAASGS